MSWVDNLAGGWEVPPNRPSHVIGLAVVAAGAAVCRMQWLIRAQNGHGLIAVHYISLIVVNCDSSGLHWINTGMMD